MVADRLYCRIPVWDRVEAPEAGGLGAAGAVFAGHCLDSRLVVSSPRPVQRHLLWPDRAQRPPLADRSRPSRV